MSVENTDKPKKKRGSKTVVGRRSQSDAARVTTIKKSIPLMDEEGGKIRQDDLDAIAAIATKREAAKLAKEQAQAERERMRADREAKTLMLRSEAEAVIQTLVTVVTAELARADAFLPLEIPAEVRDACRHCLTLAGGRIRSRIAETLAQP